MNLDEFTQTLISANSQNPQQSQFHELLMQFRKENYSEYVSLNLMILQNPTDTNLAMLVTTILFNEVKTGKILEDPQLINTFLQIFLPLVPNILQLPNFLENFKIIISTTLSLIAIKKYEESDFTIQQYVIQLYQSNTAEYETFTINFVKEIIIGCEGLGGFQSDILTNFLVMPLQNEMSYIPRCKLFFGVAMRSPNDENLSKLFEAHYIQNPIPEKFMHDFLNIVIAFSEKRADFFHSHLSTFIPMLCEIAMNPDNENRNMALFVFSAMGQGSPKMCQSVPEFFITVTQCLIRVMSETNESTQIEYDPNSSESCLIAGEVFKTIVENCESGNYMRCVISIFNQVLKQVAESNNLTEGPKQAIFHLPWPFVYSIVAAYSNLQYSNGITDLIYKSITGQRVYTQIVELVQQFVPLLQLKQTVPILRIEILNLYSSIACRLLNLFLPLTGEFLIPLLREIIESDDNPMVKLAASKTLKSMFRPVSKNTVGSSLITFFPSAFEMVLQMLSQAPPYLYKNLISCLTYFTLIGKPFLPYFDHYLSVLLNIYQQPNFEMDLKLKIVSSVSMICTNLSIPIQNVETAFQNFLNDFIQIIQGNQIDEYSNEKFFKSITALLRYLGNNASQLIMVLLPRALEKSNEDIQIVQIQKLEKMEATGFTEISETETYYRNFALDSDIQTVTRALSILNNILTSMKLNTRPFIQDFINANQKWILNQYQIETIKTSAWVNLNTLINIYIKEPEMEDFINLFFDDFNATIDKTTVSIGFIVLQNLSNIMELEKPRPWFDEQRITLALSKIDLFLDKVINELRASIENIDRFQCEHESQEEGSLETVLSFISLILGHFLDIYTEVTINYMMKNNFIEKVQALYNSCNIENDSHKYFIIFSLEITTLYICKTNNNELALNWILNLFSIGEKHQGDASMKSFQFMINIFEKFELPDEFVANLQDEFEVFLQNVQYIVEHDSEHEDMISYSDWGQCAFAAFIQQNKDRIDYESAVQIFCELFPPSEENEISDYAFSLMVNLCYEQNPVVFSDNFPEIIDNLVSNMHFGMMKPNTSEKLINFLKGIITNPDYGPKVISVLSDSELKRNDEKILEILNAGAASLSQI